MIQFILCSQTAYMNKIIVVSPHHLYGLQQAKICLELDLGQQK